jgi:hypothetical protein
MAQISHSITQKNSETQLDVAPVEAQRVLKGSQNGGR